MQIENILQVLFPGTPFFRGKNCRDATVSGKDDFLRGTGLHFTDPDRLVNCPVLEAVGSPVLILEGFRQERYVSSALFSERGYEVITSVECAIPPLSCRVKHGVPGMIKSPVVLPLEQLRMMGDVLLVSDGSSIFSRKLFRAGTMNSMPDRQIKEIEMLECLIEHL